MTQVEGAEICGRQSAILSGLESMEETRFVNQSSTSLMILIDPQEQTGWVILLSGQRKSTCRRHTGAKTWNVSLECVGVESTHIFSGFIFNDLTLNFITGYDWNKGEPNDKSTDQACIVMMIPAGKGDVKHGKLDDINCTTSGKFKSRGVLCGKEAK